MDVPEKPKEKTFSLGAGKRAGLKPERGNPVA